MGLHDNEREERERISAERGDGGSTSYYSLPEGATELRQIIKSKRMEHGIGEAFCALYRLNDNGEYLRNLKKAAYYIACEIEHEEAKGSPEEALDRRGPETTRRYQQVICEHARREGSDRRRET